MAGSLFRYVLLLCAILPVFLSQSAHAQVTLGDFVRVDPSPITIANDAITFNRRTFETTYRISLTNNSSNPVSGPFYLAISDVTSAQVTLTNADDTSAEGTPVFLLNVTELAVGASITTNVIFANPNRAQFDFTRQAFAPPPATGPPAISITSPVTGLLTRADQIDVLGTVSGGISSVTVAGVAASLSGTNFSATVPLREGSNMLTAVGSFNGMAVTSTVSVVRDTTAPTVVITSPPNGFVTTNSQLTITGEFVDAASSIVEAVDPIVVVNGVPATVINRSFEVPGFLLQPGLNTITATGTDSAGNTSSTQIQITFAAEAGQRMQELLGSNQLGTVGETLPDPLVVRLSDRSGNPVAERPVTFSVSQGDGAVSTVGQAGRNATVMTDVNGLASINFTLGERTGSGNHQVTASSPGFMGGVVFCASAQGLTPQRISVISGNNQTGIVDNKLPEMLITLVSDAMGNPVPGVDVTYEVVRGGGTFSGQQTVTIATDMEGRASTAYTLGPDAGINNNAVRASFQGLIQTASSYTFSAMEPAPVANTTVSGVVLDNSNLPIPGATARIVGTALTAVTDAEGMFTITNVPVDTILLEVDGTTSTRPETYPILDFELVTISGQDNTVGMPIFLPALDVAGAKVVGGPEDVTIEMAGVPGATLTVFANSVTFHDGSKTGVVSFNQVHTDKVPMQAPLGSQFMLAFSVQPIGAHFDPPARVSIPNIGGEPGQVVEMFSFDHTMGEFVSIGTASVSEDGSQLVSNPGFGITTAGWGGCVPPPPPPTCNQSCDDGNECTDDSCEDGACVNTNNTGSCDDGNDCTQGDMCSGGSCQSGDNAAEGTSCSASDSGECKADTGMCDASGSCVADDVPDGTPARTQNSPTDCQQEVCRGGSVTSEDNDGEDPGTCLKCLNGASEPDDTESCSDGNECTYNDRCEAGSCTGTDVSNNLELTRCKKCINGEIQPFNIGGACDDFNSCTGPDSCNEFGGCSGQDRSDPSPPVICKTCLNGNIVGDPRQNGQTCAEGRVCEFGVCVLAPTDPDAEPEPEPDPDEDPEGGTEEDRPKRFDVVLTMFIPLNHVKVPFCTFMLGDFFEADNRGFNKDAEFPHYRVRQEATIIVGGGQDALDDMQNKPGLAVRYHEPESLTPPGPPAGCFRQDCATCPIFQGQCIRDAARSDTVLGDGFLKDATGFAIIDGMRVDPLSIREGKVSIFMHGPARNGIVPQPCGMFAPSIDWNLELEIDNTSSPTRYSLTGNHDGFPAYELYVNGTMIYTRDPIQFGDTPASLIGSTGDVSVSCRSRPLTEECGPNP